MKRLTVAQAADVAQRHPQTIRRACETGELHGLQRVRKGRWLIHPDCLDAWLDGQKCEHHATGRKTA